MNPWKSKDDGIPSEEIVLEKRSQPVEFLHD